MKQLLQHLDNDLTEIVECPVPQVKAGHVLIETRVSLISSGTERMIVNFGRANLIEKVRMQPEKVAQVLDKVRADGVASAYEAVRSKLGQPIALGYCNVGIVRHVGEGVSNVAIGDRVVSTGAHASMVHVPSTLCAKVPDGVDDESAAFAVVGAIALQGIRLIEPAIGQRVAVIGTGIIGLLTVQLLRASGVKVLAIDPDKSRLELAAKFGAKTCCPTLGVDPLAAGEAFSEGLGCDAVLITAAASSSEPVRQAAKLSRKRGKVVLVGVADLKLDRSDFYEKELSFQVSCSYGPGRYDPAYEAGTHDYPLPFVRWTAQRNMQTLVELLEAGQVSTDGLVSHRFDFEAVSDAYDRLSQGRGDLGILLQYGSDLNDTRQVVQLATTSVPGPERSLSKAGTIGVIGAGNYASRILVPAFSKAGARIESIASAGGLSAVLLGLKADASRATTDPQTLIQDSDISSIIVATRHDLHAQFAMQALRAGKHVFVEKPLALTHADLDAIEKLARQSNACLTVGFNRRFSPLGLEMKRALGTVAGPKALIATVNAGDLPADHWVNDRLVGGGRIVGEACHQVDFLRFLVGSPISSVEVIPLARTGKGIIDSATLSIRFADGSIGTVHYFANGSRRFAKERVECFVDGRTLQLDNFQKLRGFGWKGLGTTRSWTRDKGQVACAQAFLRAAAGEAEVPIEYDELFEVARTMVDVGEALAIS